MNPATISKPMAGAMLSELKAMMIRHGDALQTTTAIPRLTIWFSSEKTEPMPLMFTPKVYLLVQGVKRMEIGNRRVECSAGHCSVTSVALPFMGQVMEASPEAPYLGIELKLDTAIIASLLQGMLEEGDADIPAINTAQATAEIVEGMYRLVRLLDTPEDVPTLMPLIERELYYRLLRGPLAGTIRQAVQIDTRLWQVRKAVEWISANPAAALSVPQLADSVGMSVTSFHRHFKAVTAVSPLVYQKHVRLLEARRLLLQEAGNVTSVAFAVGYSGSSQFSREYTRLFGLSPLRDIARLREPARPLSDSGRLY